ncbi:F-box protein At3g07870 isoform X1 [Quercus suber]|uniref:F-box protein At3g07870 isoform X1 n=2 Tax=Quercus suber TaxID=58331 RepID=UPI000CE1E49C|nr:F-box protein At3g07870-like [Quercus suber]
MSRSTEMLSLSSELLPDNVVFDILTRLPVKSLIRFRCVSQSWNSTITNPIFITKHLDLANSLSNINNNGYLLFTPVRNYPTMDPSSTQQWTTFVYNTNRTLTHISRFEIPFHNDLIIGFCNGVFCLAANNDDSDEEDLRHSLYLWNPSIRKLKKLLATHPADRAVFGFGYHPQNNDYKILRVTFAVQQVTRKPAEAEIYTLSTDSWRKALISVESFSGSDSGPNGSVDQVYFPTRLCFNGALHFIAFSGGHKFILSFDINDERFREILLPQNYLEGILKHFERLAMFKGSLALIVFGEDLVEKSDRCHIWVMKEYGVVESWARKSVPLKQVAEFFSCTINGELLIEKFTPYQSFLFDPESLNEKILSIPMPECMIYTPNFVESLVLLDR